MVFIKHSAGTITSVVFSEDELDEKQKKAFEETAEIMTGSDVEHREIVIVRDANGRRIDFYPANKPKGDA